MEDNNTLYWLIWRVTRHTTGLWLNKQYRYQKALYKMEPTNKCWECSICGQRIKNKREQSIDHIIPANILWEVELPGLLIDPRNFRSSHQKCNVERGILTINDMSPKVRDKLFALLEKRTNTPTS